MGHFDSLSSLCPCIPFTNVPTLYRAFSALLKFFFNVQGDRYQLLSIPVLAPKCSSSFYCNAAFPQGKESLGNLSHVYPGKVAVSSYARSTSGEYLHEVSSVHA